jgi:protein phosphatase PTC7
LAENGFFSFFLSFIDDKNELAGSSTACFFALEKQTGQVATANLGDSGYIILRPQSSPPEVVYRSKEQTKRFNHPFQLTVLPPEYRRPGQVLDMPSDSQRAEHSLAAGDVVVVGSDGLFDNLFDHEILKIVVEERSKHRDDAKTFTQAASDRLLKDARVIAAEKYRTTPFSQGAKEAGYKFQGGKMDDITVVTGLVVERFR